MKTTLLVLLLAWLSLSALPNPVTAPVQVAWDKVGAPIQIRDLG